MPLIMALPGPLIGAVAGLAMITVLLSAFQAAFDRKAGYQIGAFVALIVAMSNISFFSISAPFCGPGRPTRVPTRDPRRTSQQLGCGMRTHTHTRTHANTQTVTPVPAPPRPSSPED